MIKAIGRAGNGSPLLILGLSGENITRLLADEPIRLDLAELGLPAMQVVIMAGRTEDTIVAQLTKNGLIAMSWLEQPDRTATTNNERDA